MQCLCVQNVHSMGALRKHKKQAKRSIFNAYFTLHGFQSCQIIVPSAQLVVSSMTCVQAVRGTFYIMLKHSCTIKLAVSRTVFVGWPKCYSYTGDPPRGFPSLRVVHSHWGPTCKPRATADLTLVRELISIRYGLENLGSSGVVWTRHKLDLIRDDCTIWTLTRLVKIVS